MRKLLVAILFAGIAFGSLLTPVSAETMSKAESQRLFMKGAELWPIYCNQCHNARPGSEKAPYEWNQIIMHMRMLGNIPASDQRALVQYLKGGR